MVSRNQGSESLRPWICDPVRRGSGMRILLIHRKLERWNRVPELVGGVHESSPYVRFLASFRTFLF